MILTSFCSALCSCVELPGIENTDEHDDDVDVEDDEEGNADDKLSSVPVRGDCLLFRFRCIYCIYCADVYWFYFSITNFYNVSSIL